MWALRGSACWACLQSSRPLRCSFRWREAEGVARQARGRRRSRRAPCGDRRTSSRNSLARGHCSRLTASRPASSSSSSEYSARSIGLPPAPGGRRSAILEQSSRCRSGGPAGVRGQNRRRVRQIQARPGRARGRPRPAATQRRGERVPDREKEQEGRQAVLRRAMPSSWSPARGSCSGRPARSPSGRGSRSATPPQTRAATTRHCAGNARRGRPGEQGRGRDAGRRCGRRPRPSPRTGSCRPGTRRGRARPRPR